MRLSGKGRMPEPRVHWGAGDIGGPRHEYRESLMLKLLRRDLQSGSVVLDAGCGSGSLLFKLARFDCMVHAIEQSKEYAGMLYNRIRSAGISNIAHVKYGSVVSIPYPDSAFDAVVSGEVLEHVRDDTGAIMEFYRILRPGGVCVISVPASPAQWDITDEWAGHLRRYTREGLVNLFEKKGFIIEDVRFWGFPFVRLYHRFLYLPHIKKKTSEGLSEDAIRPPDANRHKLMTKVLGMVFRLDSLFQWAPFGIGLILKARKPCAEVAVRVGAELDAKLGAIGCTS